MDISVFLAKLIGLYLLILGLLTLFRRHQIGATVKELASSKSFLAISGEISLLFGLVIVIDHSIWEWSWIGLITLLGYIMILKGIVRFAFPAQIKEIASKLSKETLLFIALVMIVVGGYLTYCGFTQG